VSGITRTKFINPPPAVARGISSIGTAKRS
jgi:hypothetical protein